MRKWKLVNGVIESVEIEPKKRKVKIVEHSSEYLQQILREREEIRQKYLNITTW